MNLKEVAIFEELGWDIFTGNPILVEILPEYVEELYSRLATAFSHVNFEMSLGWFSAGLDDDSDDSDEDNLASITTESFGDEDFLAQNNLIVMFAEEKKLRREEDFALVAIWAAYEWREGDGLKVRDRAAELIDYWNKNFADGVG